MALIIKQRTRRALEDGPVKSLAVYPQRVDGIDVSFSVGEHTIFLSKEEAAQIVNGWKSLVTALPDDQEMLLRF